MVTTTKVTHLAVFDSTVQQTYEWLQAITNELGWGDHSRAYLALRGTLHALRDHLVVDESAQLAAQLPMLVRGIYFEGWDPSRVPLKERSRDDFLARVAGAFDRADPAVNPEDAARAVFRVLSAKISDGEINQVRRSLPGDIQKLWR
jgi:uncharacterized protein (DUF2267 family)